MNKGISAIRIKQFAMQIATQVSENDEKFKENAEKIEKYLTKRIVITDIIPEKD